jgi:muramoyltetrapeptide carboxypeptidase
MMIVPPFLNPGDRIRIVSPAGKVSDKKIIPGIELLRQQGFEVIHGKNVFGQHFQYSGTDGQRAADLQEAMDDPETKAIICSRGGYGTARLLGYLNFSTLKDTPKWLVGFSDITVLHSVFNKLGIASIHGPMPGFFVQNEKPSASFLQLLSFLAGESPVYDFTPRQQNRKGQVQGELVGGNLSLLYSLRGTPYDLNTDGKILFLEDLSEYLYHLDRIMINLRLSGKLEKLAGLVVGNFTDMKDNENPFGKSVEEIILDAVRDYRFPVCFNFPSGHIDENMPLIFGAEYQLSVAASACTLKTLGDG